MTRTSARGGRALKVAGGVLLVGAAVEALAVALFRRRWTPGIDAVRRFNRRVLNPVMLRAAGRRHWYAAAVHHLGRSSGKPYVTPLLVFRAGEHVYIPLPYGTEVDWCRNVLAAGSCLVEDHGTQYEVVSPEIVPAAIAAPQLPARNRRQLTLFGVTHYLRATVAPERSAPGNGDGTTPRTVPDVPAGTSRQNGSGRTAAR
jgi:deazaflavin-dependent oxidoreductase (nitroreductase family)